VPTGIEVVVSHGGRGAEIFTGPPPRMVVRLQDFDTAKSTLLPVHQKWLDENFKPEVLSLMNPTVEIDGFASRLGDGKQNLLLSRQRSEAVRRWIALYSPKITFKLDARGELSSGPDPRDNEARYRAVEVRLFGKISHAIVQEAIIKTHQIIRRAQWGARPPKARLEPDWDYDTIVIHHSGNSGEKDPRAIQAGHMMKYDDVGYHYMINPGGRILEGREIIFKGSHVVRDNTRRIGILVMGDFDEQWWDKDDDLSPLQMSTLRRLIGTLQRSFPVRYLGGHIEVAAATGVERTCPGNLLMEKMDQLRKDFGLAVPTKR
jgi:hypothetical protein